MSLAHCVDVAIFFGDPNFNLCVQSLGEQAFKHLCIIHACYKIYLVKLMLVGIFHLLHAQSNPSHDRNSVLSSNAFVGGDCAEEAGAASEKSHPGEDSHQD